MKPHRTDLVSLLFGLVFVGISVWWLLAQILGMALPPVGWFLAGALLLIGVLGLIGALRSTRHADREPAGAATPEAASAPPAAPASPAAWREPGFPADATGTDPDRAGDVHSSGAAETDDQYRSDSQDTAEVRIEGLERPTAPVWGPEAPAAPEPSYRPPVEADEWPTGAVTDRPAEAVSDRPADAPVTGPPAGEYRPPA